MEVSIKLFLASIAFASFADCSKEPNYMKAQSESKSLSATDENFLREFKPEPNLQHLLLDEHVQSIIKKILPALIVPDEGSVHCFLDEDAALQLIDK